MDQLFKFAKIFEKYYNEYKQQQTQSKYINKTNVTTCNRLQTIAK